MAKPTYHLHMDAAHLPAPLLERMIHEGGFHFDDFPHELKVNGLSVPARHLTKYLYSPINSMEAKRECQKVASWAHESDFKGLIQCEFVMEESEWNQKNEHHQAVEAPLQILTRPLKGQKGDHFKKHELHIEVNKTQSSSVVVDALRNCGFQILESEHTITFTMAGHSKEMLTIRKVLKRFLNEHGDRLTAKLTYEATAFWSLHGIESKCLPMIADQVKILE